jgi:glycosyltransferase involved in cell wall biosynthesis
LGGIAAPRSSLHSHFRILHAVFSSRIAGSERYCIDLANRQAALGHEVHVVGRSGSPIAAALVPGVHFHAVGRFFAGWQLRRLVKRISPDICHGHLSGACKALACIEGPFPRVATLHVGYKPHQHATLDGLICVNRTQATRIEGYGGVILSIPNWLPAPLGAPAAPALRADLGIGPDTFVIGSVGRLHASKGADVLIKAFRHAAPDNTALVLVGDGPQRPDLERLRDGDPRIHLVGYRSDVHACLHGFDLFVSPSREESFGLAIIEAMSAGLPVIATAAEGPAEYLMDQPVTLVPPGEAADLATAINDAAVRFRAGQLTSIRYDLSRFDPDARVGNVMEFYRQVRARRATIPAPSWVPAQATT